MSEQGDRVAAGARDLIGTPWHLGARVPGRGIDCVGVLICALRAAGKEPRDVVVYSDAPSLDLLLGNLGEFEQVEEPEPGDAAIFAFPGHGYEIGHVGVLIETDTVVHVTPKRPRHAHTGSLRGPLGRRLVAFYRFKG